MNRKKQKHDMTMLYEFILLVAVVVIVAIMVFQINEDARDDIVSSQTETETCNASSGVYTGCGTAYNATLDADTSVAKIPKSLKLLGTAVIFGAVLWVILRVIPMGRGAGSSFQ
jgi:uncharacterized membrane protein